MGNKNNDYVTDLIANVIVSLIVGIIGASIAVYILVKTNKKDGSSWMWGIGVGFLVGAIYGLWHAYFGHKKNN